MSEHTPEHAHAVMAVHNPIFILTADEEGHLRLYSRIPMHDVAQVLRDTVTDIERGGGQITIPGGGL